MTDIGIDSEQYRKARELILELGAAPQSWLQRQLRLTREEAARLIEHMQHEGLVSPPDAVGRRKILGVDEEGER